MDVIDIIPVDEQVQTTLRGTDAKQQRKIRSRLRKQLSISFGRSVRLVQQLAEGQMQPRTYAESSALLEREAPELVAKARAEAAAKSQYAAMRVLRREIDGLGLIHVKHLSESLL